MTSHQFHVVIRTLKKIIPQWEVPAVGKIAERHRTPFHVLISTLISLRTKDQVTNEASQRLFELVNTPQEMTPTSTAKTSVSRSPPGAAPSRRI